MKKSKFGRYFAFALVALAVTGCATTRDTTISEGSITGITSAEGTTLMKSQQRTAKVAAVQTNQKPIFKMTGHEGRPITIDAASFEVYVPMDVNVLLAEQDDVTSEDVLKMREARGILRETVAPIGFGVLVANDRKNASNNAARIEEARSTERAATLEAFNGLAQTAQRDPLVLTISEGGSAAVLK